MNEPTSSPAISRRSRLTLPDNARGGVEAVIEPTAESRTSTVQIGIGERRFDDPSHEPLIVFRVLASSDFSGGADAHTRLLCADLERLGVRIGIVAHEGPLVQTLRRETNWEIHTFRRSVRMRATLAMASMFRAERPHIVPTHKPVADVVGLTAARLAGVPAVATIHVRHNTERRLHRTRVFPVIPASPARRLVLRRFAQRLIAVSDSTRDHALSSLGVDPERVLTVRNGTDIHRFRRLTGADVTEVRSTLLRSRTAFLIGIVARFVSNKGFDLLFDALPAVIAKHPDTEVVFVGATPPYEKYVGRLRDRIAVLGLEDHVSIHPRSNDVPRLLNALDLFVQPSRVEGLSRALLEAMASKTPVIATPVDGHRELLVPGVNSLIVSHHDPDQLANAILRVRDNAAEARARARAGRQTVEEGFTSVRAAQQTLSVYRDVMSTSRSPRDAGAPSLSQTATPRIDPTR